MEYTYPLRRAKREDQIWNNAAYNVPEKENHTNAIPSTTPESK